MGVKDTILSFIVAAIVGIALFEVHMSRFKEFKSTDAGISQRELNTHYIHGGIQITDNEGAINNHGWTVG